MSVAVTLSTQVTVLETLETNVPFATAPTVNHTGMNLTTDLNAGTTPPATKVAAFNKALSGGAGTIDLTALTGTNGATVDMTGLKVQAFKAIAKSTNANAITLKYGASNPYNLLGASWQVILAAGQEFTFYGNDAAPDVAAGAKTIDLSGTLTQSVDIIIVAG